jgi:enoyl-CoA hydratase/carnithine racemase
MTPISIQVLLVQSFSANKKNCIFAKTFVMSYTTLLTQLENNILTITINRPDKLNALNRDVFTDLSNVVDEIESNNEIKSAIIIGSGAKAFVAGADITEFNSLTLEGYFL